MLGFLGAALGSPRAVERVVGAATRGIDALVYTGREKASDQAALELQRADIAHRAQGQVVEWMRATQPAAMSRRVLAFLVAGVWASAELLAMGLRMAAPWAAPETAAAMMLSAEACAVALDDVDAWMMLILAFYFASPALQPVAERIVEARLAREPRVPGPPAPAGSVLGDITPPRPRRPRKATAA